MKYPITFTLNGGQVEVDVPASMNLLALLRDGVKPNWDQIWL